jgi:hypothetical protein
MPYGRPYRRTRNTRGFRRRRAPAPRKAAGGKVARLTRAKGVNRMLLKNRSMMLQNRTMLRGRLQMNLLGTDSQLVPIASKPLCFDVTNFATGLQPDTNDAYNPVYQFTTPVTGDPVLATATYFKRLEGPLTLQNPYWAAANGDIPNTGNVYAESRFFRFIIKGNEQLDNTRINIRFVQAKFMRMTGNSLKGYTPVVLPATLNHMQNLLTTNMVNGRFFKTLYNKTLFINSHTYTITTQGVQTGQTATTGNILHHTVAFRLKRKLKQVATDPGAVQTNGGYGNGWRWTARPMAGYYAPIWCIISTDDVTSLNDAVNIQIESICRWRDPVGGAQ